MRNQAWLLGLFLFLAPASSVAAEDVSADAINELVVNVSKNVPARRFGPPKYEDAKFKYAGGQMTIDIKLLY